jgi:hypothetical protein
MKRFLPVVSALLLSTTMHLPARAHAPAAFNATAAPMTAASRAHLLDTLVKEVGDRYVFPEQASKVHAFLRAQQQRGAYDRITDARQFSEALTRDLQATTTDRHLHVSYSAQPMPLMQTRGAPSAADVAARLSSMRANNFGVEQVARLPGNIGYLELTGFASAQDAAPTLAAAMTMLAHTDALIIDLRHNGGGDAATVALLASYFFDGRTRLNDFYQRQDHRIEERWTTDGAAGPRYGQKKDVIILTSQETFSAAEDFSYALKNLKRATLVGETTGGGANPGKDVRLTPHFSVFLPHGRAVSPVTKTNWEGVGVTPDIAVPAAAALKTAELAILKKLATLEHDPEQRSNLHERISELSGGLSSPAP